MPEGGFAVKYDGKLTKRCYSVSFDFDKDEVTYNNRDTQRLPKGVKSITIDVERGERYY